MRDSTVCFIHIVDRLAQNKLTSAAWVLMFAAAFADCLSVMQIV